jgi:hypothetical protein
MEANFTNKNSFFILYKITIFFIIILTVAIVLIFLSNDKITQKNEVVIIDIINKTNICPFIQDEFEKINNNQKNL